MPAVLRPDLKAAVWAVIGYVAIGYAMKAVRK